MGFVIYLGKDKIYTAERMPEADTLQTIVDRLTDIGVVDSISFMSFGMCLADFCYKRSPMEFYYIGKLPMVVVRNHPILVAMVEETLKDLAR